ncbi:MAG TPA: hypothetical protein DCX46_06790 [Bacteroidetes bacterium]|nr:hypothetical protein [Bacteroidota bacterium]
MRYAYTAPLRTDKRAHYIDRKRLIDTSNRSRSDRVIPDRPFMVGTVNKQYTPVGDRRGE